MFKAQGARWFDSGCVSISFLINPIKVTPRGCAFPGLCPFLLSASIICRSRGILVQPCTQTSGHSSTCCGGKLPVRFQSCANRFSRTFRQMAWAVIATSHVTTHTYTHNLAPPLSNILSPSLPHPCIYTLTLKECRRCIFQL